MTVLLCPGIHDPRLTDEFLSALHGGSSKCLVFPAHDYSAYSALDILHFLKMISMDDRALLFVGFSAGVVGAIGAAFGWQWMGNPVKALIAIDGWGMPLMGHFPIHRISHDAFTHWSSSPLGICEILGDRFYADPSVPHLDLWRSPTTVHGWWTHYASSPSLNAPPGFQWPASPLQTYTTEQDFLVSLLQRYGET